MDQIVQDTNPVVGLGKKATLDLAVGPRYKVIHLDVDATAVEGETLVLSDVLDLVNLKVNGKVKRAHTADQLNQIYSDYGANYAVQVNKLDDNGNELFGTAPGAGDSARFHFAIFLAEDWRKSYSATEAMAWPTVWRDKNGQEAALRSFQLEIFCPNTGNVDATKAVTCIGWAETDNAVGQVDGLLANGGSPIALGTMFDMAQIPYTAVGNQTINTLDKRDVYQQISIFMPGTDSVDAIQVKVDNVIKRDVSKAKNDVANCNRGWNKAAVSAQRFTLGFDYTDLPTDGLSMAGVRAFDVIPHIAAAAAQNKTMTFISQIYGSYLA